MQCNLACLLWAISGHLESRKNDIFLIWLRLSADRAAKAQEVAIRVFDGELAEAVRKILRTPFGLTAAIFTKDIDRAMEFVYSAVAGMTVVNGPTYGSEPHMPFGGFRDSGNGFREAGTEALDVYSDWKTISIFSESEHL